MSSPGRGALVAVRVRLEEVHETLVVVARTVLLEVDVVSWVVLAGAAKVVEGRRRRWNHQVAARIGRTLQVATRVLVIKVLAVGHQVCVWGLIIVSFSLLISLERWRESN